MQMMINNYKFSSRSSIQNQGTKLNFIWQPQVSMEKAVNMRERT